jgi:hypothetical protein
MIFGFNSDVKQDETVYHVQSEVREAERLLDSLVFVRGRCIGKHATPLPDGDSLSEDALHDLLKEQHRQVLTAIREGELANLFPAFRPAIEFLSALARVEDKTMVLRFHVSPAPVRISASLETDGNQPVSMEEDVPADGMVELVFPFDGLASSNACVVVQARAAGGMVTQKFPLHRK